MRLILGVLLLQACVGSDAVPCGHDLVCGPGLACRAVGTDTVCVSPEQITACAGVADGASCDFGSCHDGVCLPIACGNHRVDPGEVCDDGNNITGDGCSADCKSDEVCGNGVVDLMRNETCDLGPTGRALSHDGCSSACTVERPQWDQLADPLGFFGTSSSVALAYDARRDRVVFFSEARGQPRTVEWDGHYFLQPSPAASPASRTGAAMAYDAAHDVSVLFGGLGFSDTWTWNGATWTLEQPAVSPTTRGFAAMAYDPIHRRIVLFGGASDVIGSGGVFGETWTWDGTTWARLVTTGATPSARGGAAMAFDPERGVIVMFGGAASTNGMDIYNDTWELSGTTWTLRTPAASPPKRYGHALAFDPATHRMVMTGGTGTDTWTWDGTAWTEVVSTMAPALGFRSATTRKAKAVAMSSQMFAEWDATAWSPVISTTTTFTPRSQMAGAADIAGRRVLVYGGLLSTVTQQAFLWNGAWQLLPTVGGPGTLNAAAMAYDTHRDEFVMFGGSTGTQDSGKTWIYGSSGWIERMPAQAPSARSGPAMAYDAARERVVLFGGISSAGLFADTWVWDGVTWTPAPGGPPSRYSSAMAYDPIRHEVVMFGGATTGFAELGDTWIWDGTAWHQRMVNGPGPRNAAGMAWDASRERLVLYGGSPGSTNAFNDAWEWDGTSWSEVSTTQPLLRRSDHLMVPALDGAGVISMGGDASFATRYDEVAVLRWIGGARDEALPSLDLDGDGLGTGGCAMADPDLWALCTPACPPGTSCAGSERRCGDQVCDPARESCSLCPEDCGACPAACGDFVCAPSESPATCPGDCS